MTASDILRRAAVITLVVCLRVSAARSEQARLATTTPAEIQSGEADGIAVTSLGRLFLAPRISPIGKALPGGPPSQVFSASADKAGNIFLGTGPDGQVVKLTRNGDQQVFFRVDEPLVTAVLALPTGAILVASAPGGKIYKVGPDGRGSVWCRTDERYVWALAAAANDSVLAATGEQGRLLKIDRNGNSSVMFDGDETHLVSLAMAKDGVVWAGGAGRGLVYRIDPEGHGLVVYDDELPEAKAILPMPSGDLIVAFDAAPVLEKRPPALRLRVAGGTAGAGEAMSDLDARQTPALQGVIEGLPPAAADETVPLRGKVVRLRPDGGVVELWRSRAEAPFALALDSGSRPVFATGEPAKLWRVEAPDEIALLATLKEAQATAFAQATGTAIVAATSNPAAAYRLENELAESGTFLALPADAGSVARWGTVRWRSTGTGGRMELFTRTGNSEDPDGTWSAWSPAQVESQGRPVASPEGRYLQWRARMTSTSSDGPCIEGVTASYATRNRAPSIRDLRVEPATGAVSAKATLRWSAADPDGDGVTVTIQARKAGTSAWATAVVNEAPPVKPSDPTFGNDGSSKDGKATWDTASWDEGRYEIRAVATDQPANAPGEGLEADTEISLPVCIDRTPPSIVTKSNSGTIEVVVEDALSQVARLEVTANGRVLFSPRCEDGVCDNTKETFRFPVPRAAQDEPWSLKATDAAGNAAETPAPMP
jgi:hypothetical protein